MPFLPVSYSSLFPVIVYVFLLVSFYRLLPILDYVFLAFVFQECFLLDNVFLAYIFLDCAPVFPSQSRMLFSASPRMLFPSYPKELFFYTPVLECSFLLCHAFSIPIRENVFPSDKERFLLSWSRRLNVVIRYSELLNLFWTHTSIKK